MRLPSSLKATLGGGARDCLQPLQHERRIKASYGSPTCADARRIEPRQRQQALRDRPQADRASRLTVNFPSRRPDSVITMPGSAEAAPGSFPSGVRSASAARPRRLATSSRIGAATSQGNRRRERNTACLRCARQPASSASISAKPELSPSNSSKAWCRSAWIRATTSSSVSCSSSGGLPRMTATSVADGPGSDHSRNSPSRNVSSPCCPAPLNGIPDEILDRRQHCRNQLRILASSRRARRHGRSAGRCGDGSGKHARPGRRACA